ncbi:MAG TPA: class I SAM-dependent methyltransferase, partial [Candidatus Tectomicrobia bacterium]|nr:class I SAM-dependent methyltransferase [Candidatus Tectomicrobia bacterium]
MSAGTGATMASAGPSAPTALRRPLPRQRTYEQVRRHYEIEKALADRLRGSPRPERLQILRTMYAELFRQVPDHPRLTRRADPAATARAVHAQLALVGRWLRPGACFAEFGAGDCELAMHVAARTRTVVAIDISDQRRPGRACPGNFHLLLYDGLAVPLAAGATDVAFSDQLLEHFHPEDTPGHVAEVARILRRGGVYVFHTPHRFTGPADISRFFSDEPQGFHLKEWTYTEVFALLRAGGFRGSRGYWRGRGLYVPLPAGWWRAVEARLAPL